MIFNSVAVLCLLMYLPESKSTQIDKAKNSGHEKYEKKAKIQIKVET